MMKGQSLMKQKRKKPRLIIILHPILPMVPSPLPNPEEYFYQLFCKCKLLVALETFLRREAHIITFLGVNDFLGSKIHLLVLYFLIQPENSGVMNYESFDCLRCQLNSP